MIVLSLVYTFFLSFYLMIYHLNFFQKQYYDFTRYFKLIKEKFTFSWVKGIFFVFLGVLSFIPSFFKYMDVIRYVLIAIIAFFLYRTKVNDKIIPFKITKRVKRFFIQYSVIYAIFIFVMIISHCNAAFVPFIYRCLFMIAFLATGCLNIGIEKIYLNHYKKKAKNKIKKCVNLKIIGISGSYGKSSTKYYVKHLLDTNYRVLTTPKSYNTMNGILMTINKDLSMSHEILLLELGIDKINGMNKYIKTFPFDVCALTGIGIQHLATFKTIQNIENEKIKLLTHLKSNQVAIINLDEERIIKHLEEINANKITISAFKQADIYAQNIQAKATGTNFDLHIYDKVYSIKTHILGRHHIHNILIAVAIAKHFQIQDEVIVKRLKSLKNLNHRLELKKEGLWNIIDDSYNSNPRGFIEALEVLKTASTKKILITPGLIELNQYNESLNKKIATYIKKSVDLVVLVGKNADSIHQELLFEKMDEKKIEHFNSFIEAIDYLKNNYIDQKITILIENDLPDSYLK